ncbi:hypothetical protein [Marinicella meishanensis]|uniref:hypothetical protein n=1 Tax=Marinicella meishanensis TaxID=2873263 RepID=UPI001CC04DC9|nr:hypothetical protein [Marinicella sp. NBU2979]
MAAQFGASFTFKDWQLNPASGQLLLHYHTPEWGDFTEQLDFPVVPDSRIEQLGGALTVAIDCLFWMAGVSYYKTTLAQDIRFQGRRPDEDQARWLTDTWQAGLAELAVANDLPWLDHIHISGEARAPVTQPPLALAAKTLVAIGGGKDSLVTIESLKHLGEPATALQVGQSAFIAEVAHHTDLPLLAIGRRVDAKLTQVNTAGAFNGHVPVTAINACIGVVAALLTDCDSVVFANERSADVGNFQTTDGRWVNHQYSKSLVYERQWQHIIKHHVAPDLHCFSLLRPFSELAIIKKFAQYPAYFPVFSSCNRNFHLAGSQNKTHHWCGQCPKCAFVFLCLAPFVSPPQLFTIFHKNLLDDVSLYPLFDALLGLQGNKPFECVGEAAECRLAIELLSQQPAWQAHPRIVHWQSVLPAMPAAQQTALMQPATDHMIPDKRQFQQVIGHVA